MLNEFKCVRQLLGKVPERENKEGGGAPVRVFDPGAGATSS